ncbi:hypothetical protein CMUS01_06525 [Colletotrichum musicola]|uniref:Uncharacterized protein n=1 Tax=Colletotrichum musicola TaxID=2175873 RepID=A0A8H6KM92_9PEZI|nr:hypothetical protein CMUS01_06525 [Colletotrichum musicola]
MGRVSVDGASIPSAPPMAKISRTRVMTSYVIMFLGELPTQFAAGEGVPSSNGTNGAGVNLRPFAGSSREGVSRLPTTNKRDAQVPCLPLSPDCFLLGDTTPEPGLDPDPDLDLDLGLNMDLGNSLPLPLASKAHVAGSKVQGPSALWPWLPSANLTSAKTVNSPTTT